MQPVLASSAQLQQQSRLLQPCRSQALSLRAPAQLSSSARSLNRQPCQLLQCQQDRWQPSRQPVSAPTASRKDNIICQAAADAAGACGGAADPECYCCRLMVAVTNPICAGCIRHSKYIKES
jgi:hypothetical protein